MTFLLIVTSGLALVLLPWFVWMLAIVAAALTQRLGRRREQAPIESMSRFLFVIPAHDEAEVIGITVQSCLSVAYDRERFQVFVIADNCNDATATIAEQAGALVMVRTDLSRKSKGYALEDFFATEASNAAIRPHDAYVLVDADTSVAPDLLQKLDCALSRGDDFIQGYYTVRNADASWRTRMMTYAFSLANGVWLAGLDELGISVGLKGNGMCFRAIALKRFPWRAYGLVEDMEFAWNLRIAGERVRFLPEARVYGEMVSRGGVGAGSQRQRWESGRVALRAAFRPRLWASKHLSFFRKVACEIDLDFPPLSRLVMALALTTALATIVLVISRASSISCFVAGVVVFDWIVLVVYGLSPILILNLPVRYLGSLAFVPYYLAWKMSLGLLKRPQQWVRTPREATSEITPPR